MTEPRSWRDVAAELRPLVKRGDQKTIASRLGLTDAALSRYLDGKRTPPPHVAVAIAAAFERNYVEMAGLAEVGSTQIVNATIGDREISGVGAPLVAEDVAAGAGALPSVTDEKLYFFHEGWLRKRGWHPGDKDRFCCIKLGRSNIASSMLPTILPGSLLLLDRKAVASQAKDRSIWLVEIPEDEAPAVKRVTMRGKVLVLESDNPDPKYAPRIVPLTDVAVQDVLRGRVLWWATEVE